MIDHLIWIIPNILFLGVMIYSLRWEIEEPATMRKVAERIKAEIPFAVPKSEGEIPIKINLSPLPLPTLILSPKKS